MALIFILNIEPVQKNEFSTASSTDKRLTLKKNPDPFSVLFCRFFGLVGIYIFVLVHGVRVYIHGWILSWLFITLDNFQRLFSPLRYIFSAKIPRIAYR